jgi:hypothetical protein
MFSEGGIFPLRRRRSARTTRRAAIIMAEEPTVEPTEEATTETETPADAPVVGEKRKADDAKADDADAPADADADADEPDAKKQATEPETTEPEKPKYAPVKLGPKTFETPEDMVKYFSWILNNMTINQDMNDYERMVVEPCLRTAHPDAEKKIGSGIKAFQIRTHPEHETRCYTVIRTDGTTEDFSYRKCVEVLFPGYTPNAPKNSGGRGGGRGGGGRGRGGGGRGRGGGGRGGGGRGGGGRGGRGGGRGGRGGGRGGRGGRGRGGRK